MKAVKAILFFVIIYAAVAAVNGTIELIDWASRGNDYMAWGLYGLLLVLAILYLVVPILDYMNRPSLKMLEDVLKLDHRAIRRVRRHLLNQLEGEPLEKLKAIDKKDHEAIKEFVRDFIIEETDQYDSIIKGYAFKLTSTVLLSPNGLIDGLAILYGNSSMIYELTKRTKFRYTGKELFNMYFSVISVASVSGLMEAFDDELEAIITEVVEEFGEVIGEETGRTIGDSIPLVNVAVRASTVLFQAAGNYAFVTYNGNRFKYRLRNAVNFDKKTEAEIKRQSRKEARRSRYLYMQEMVKSMSATGVTSLKEMLSFKKRFGKEKVRPEV